MNTQPKEKKVVAAGTWFYDKTVPCPITIYAMTALDAAARYDDPVLQTPDGFVYLCYVDGYWRQAGGEHLSLDAAKAWADAQPWGPVIWD